MVEIPHGKIELRDDRTKQNWTVEINPFLVWLANAKTATYTAADIQSTRHACAEALGMIGKM